MSDEVATNRRLSTPVEILIGAVIGAILGWPITKWLDGLAADNNWPSWVYLIGIVVGIATALFFMTLVIRNWRLAFWGGIGRALKWIWSWHPVSARRHSKELASGRAVQEKVLRAWHDALQQIADQAVKENEAAREELDNLKTRYARAIADATNNARADARAEAADRYAPQPPPEAEPPSIPPPEPRWSVTHLDTDLGTGLHEFAIKNSVPRSVAKEVRVEKGDLYRVTDAGHFENLSGEGEALFRAEVHDPGSTDGFVMTISWYDDDYIKKFEVLYIQPWEERTGGRLRHWG